MKLLALRIFDLNPALNHNRFLLLIGETNLRG